MSSSLFENRAADIARQMATQLHWWFPYRRRRAPPPWSGQPFVNEPSTYSCITVGSSGQGIIWRSRVELVPNGRLFIHEAASGSVLSVAAAGVLADQHGLADHLAVDHRLHRLGRLRQREAMRDARPQLALRCEFGSAFMLAIASSGLASFSPPMRTPIASMPLISR